jgi:ankyrin repeat protein
MVFANAAKLPLYVVFLLALLPPALPQNADEEGPPEEFLRAIRRHDTNTIAQLLAANTNLASAPSLGNRRPLLQAAAEGSIEIVDLLLRAGAAVDVEGDTWDTSNHRFTALEIAVWYNHPAVVKRLLETGANPNHLSSSESGALHMAFTYKREEIAGMLLERGANPFLLNPFPFSNQKSALELAIVHCNGKLVPRMLRDGSAAEQFLQTNGPAMLAAAACRGQLEAVQALLEAGASAKVSA